MGSKEDIPKAGIFMHGLGYIDNIFRHNDHTGICLFLKLNQVKEGVWGGFDKSIVKIFFFNKRDKPGSFILEFFFGKPGCIDILDTEMMEKIIQMGQ